MHRRGNVQPSGAYFLLGDAQLLRSILCNIISGQLEREQAGDMIARAGCRLGYLKVGEGISLSLSFWECLKGSLSKQERLSVHGG